MTPQSRGPNEWQPHSVPVLSRTPSMVEGTELGEGTRRSVRWITSKIKLALRNGDEGEKDYMAMSFPLSLVSRDQDSGVVQ